MLFSFHCSSSTPCKTSPTRPPSASPWPSPLKGTKTMKNQSISAYCTERKWPRKVGKPPEEERKAHSACVFLSIDFLTIVAGGELASLDLGVRTYRSGDEMSLFLAVTKKASRIETRVKRKKRSFFPSLFPHARYLTKKTACEMSSRPEGFPLAANLYSRL